VRTFSSHNPGTHPAAPSGRFTKDRRVRRRSEYQQVFERGSRVQSRFFTFVLVPNGGSLPRLGLVASRKFGGAVARNRAKRLIREMFRQELPRASGFGADLVVIPKTGLLGASSRAVAEDFQSAWRRAVDRIAAHARR
jgi:ribonuclease P protein component